MNGILIGLEPVILRAGPLTVRWFGLLLVAAVAAGLWLVVRRARGLGIPAFVVLDLASWALPLGFLGARVFHLVENWDYYATRPGAALDLAAGGLDVWGGLLVGWLVVWLLCRRRRLPFPILADAAAPALALAEAIGRLGAFLNGDGQGRPSSLPWATLYSSSNAFTPDFGVPRHPAQVYQGLADLAILGLLWALRGTRLPAGARWWLWLGLYGLSRLAIGYVRLDPTFLFGLQLGQLVALAAVLAAASGIIRSVSRGPLARAVPSR